MRISPHRRLLPREEALERARRAAAVLAREPGVRLVFLFGSTTDPEQPWVRDIDLAVSTESPWTLAQRLQAQAEARTTAAAEIDLVPLDSAGVVLAREIAATGHCLFARSPEDRLDFIERAHKRYWDFKPFLELQWAAARERLESQADAAA